VAPPDSLARLRKRVLDRVSSGEVTVVTACREAGISRARYYQLRRRYLAYGEAGLRPKPHPARPTRQLAPALADAIVSYAISHPTEGERSIAQALRLARFGAWRVSHGGVRNVLRRAGLARRLARLAAAEALSAAEGGPLTERTLREIRAVERPKIMHIGSDVVGAELFADTMYVGKLKGVGTIWQYTMVDGACSFGFGRVRAGRKSAKSMARFLEEDVLPVYREAKIRLVRINTDGGPEFGRAFTQKCIELGIEHHRLPPRSPDLNAFVERFQGSCLHLHYRSAFRYRYYHSAVDIDADLQAWLRHYNFERPHRGYRTQGRTPASIFYAHRPKLLKMKGWDPNEIRIQARAV
jgi:transposase InsO family protein